MSSPEFLADPITHFRQMRENVPVYQREPGRWVLTRYRDCRAVLEDPRVKNIPKVRCHPDSKNTTQARPVDPDNVAASTIRKLVTRRFTPGALKKIQPRVVAVANQVIDAAVAKNDVDFVEDVAYPLALGTLCEYLGVPQLGLNRFRGSADHILRGFDNLIDGTEGLEGRVDHGMSGFSEFMRQAIDEKRRHPGEDLLSELIERLNGIDPRLTYIDLPYAFASVLISGYESSSSFFAGSGRAFAAFPEERRRFVADPSVHVSGVEELMRYCTPIWYIARQAFEDIEVGGHTIKEGDHIVPVLVAANRDPETFPDPDRLILDRSPNKHLAFGHGPHVCFAVTLTKLQAKLALPLLLQKATGLRATGEPTYKETVLVRNYASMPMRLV
ncbi:MAG: cytochrome P450 [Micromonosporaceae bacterium]